MEKKGFPSDTYIFNDRFSLELESFKQANSEVDRLSSYSVKVNGKAGAYTLEVFTPTSPGPYDEPGVFLSYSVKEENDPELFSEIVKLIESQKDSIIKFTADNSVANYPL